MDFMNEMKQLNISIIQFFCSTLEKNSTIKYPSTLQFGILDQLYHMNSHSMYQKELQEKLNVSKASISDGIKSMKKKKLLKQIPSSIDGRKNRIVLTEEGECFFREMEQEILKINDKVLSTITEEEYQELIRIMHKIKENLRKEEDIC